MKRLIALLLICAMLTGCASQTVSDPDSEPTNDTVVETVEFKNLNDPSLLDYVEETVYSDLVLQLNSENYLIENVQAIYISKEYIDELTYNSQSNIYFGYTLAELDAFFQDTRYVFTLGEDGQTTVKPFEIKKLLVLIKDIDQQSRTDAAKETGYDSDCQGRHTERCTVNDQLWVQ